MLWQILQRFEPFQALRAPELRSVAQHAQLLHLPSARWLLRPGRRLTGSYYLLHGRLQLNGPNQELDATQPHAQRAFYPGVAAIKSLSPVQVIQVDTGPIEFLWQSLSGGVEYQHRVEDEVWLSRFLNSPMLCPLNREQWQGLLRGSRIHSVARSQAVVSQGEPGDDFYVIKRGSAKVLRGHKVLAHLSPGDFFGEDALITGAPRNATEVMNCAGEVLRLGKREFLTYLMAQLLVASEAEATAQSRSRLPEVQLSLSPTSGLTITSRTLYVPLTQFRDIARRLAPKRMYVITGGSVDEQALALLLLSQQGLRGRFARSFTQDLAQPLVNARRVPSGLAPSAVTD